MYALLFHNRLGRSKAIRNADMGSYEIAADAFKDHHHARLDEEFKVWNLVVNISKPQCKGDGRVHIGSSGHDRSDAASHLEIGPEAYIETIQKLTVRRNRKHYERGGDIRPARGVVQESD